MSVSSLINVCPAIELLTKQALIKSFREQYGQVKNVANTTSNASTALVTDGEFSFPVKKGQTYHVQGRFAVSTGATPGFKFQLTAPASTTSATTFVGKATATQGTANVAGVTLAYNTGLNTPIYNSAVAYSMITVDAIYIPEADDLLTVQTAQSVSDASDSSLLRGSWMRVVQLKSSGVSTVPSSL